MFHPSTAIPLLLTVFNSTSCTSYNLSRHSFNLTTSSFGLQSHPSAQRKELLCVQSLYDLLSDFTLIN